MKPTVVIVTVPGMIEEKDWTQLSSKADVQYVERGSISQEELLDLIQNKDYLMLNFDVIKKLDENFYKKLKEKNPQLRAITSDITDMAWAHPEYAKKYGIKLLFIPSYSTISVAEYSMACLLLHVKKLHLAFLDRKLQREERVRKNDVVFKKTLGILGLGNIGKRMAELGIGMGMKILAYNRTPNISAPNVKQVSLDELFKQSDYISINLKSTQETLGLITEKYLSLCKNGAIIVNQADGKIVNNDDMLKFIQSGQIGGYSTFSKSLKNHPLEKEENVTSFPAQAWFTDYSLDNLKKIWIQNILSAIQGNFENLAY